MPPLMYDRVLRLKEDFPHLQFSLNGGIKSLDDVQKYLDLGVRAFFRVALTRPILSSRHHSTAVAFHYYPLSALNLSILYSFRGHFLTIARVLSCSHTSTNS